jgi:hypothetical protein
MAAAEQKKSYAVIKNFKGLNTKANRTAIDEDEFGWIENAMPIGFGNIKIVPGQSALNSANVAVNFGNTVTVLTSASVNVSDYLLAFESNGRAEFYNLTSSSLGNIAASGTFSGSSITTAQYKNERVIIGDPSKGLYNWDGNTVVSIGSVGVIGITNPGSGYTTAPTVTIGAPNETGGEQATAVSTITTGSGGIARINITSGGTGYTIVPNVIIGAPDLVGGIRAEAGVTVSGGVVVAVVITNPGSGYTAAPSVTFTSGAATATAVVSTGSVNSITLTNAGTGYTSSPSVTITGGGGNNATAIASFNTFKTGTVAVQITNGGTGYTNAANTVVNITGSGSNAAGTAILSGGQVTQVIMSNPGSGYTSNTSVTITGGGGSNAAAIAVTNLDPIVDVATFSGRTWVAAGRTLYYSAAGSYSDFTSVSAGSFVLTDSTLHGNIQAIISANNFLYIFGDDSINVISDLRVTSAGVTLFTNTNVSASVGSKRTYAIFPYFRSLLFMNDYGMYALVGSTTSKISDPLDGIFPYIDFTKPITGGQVLINNILCAAFNFYLDSSFPATFSTGNRYVQAVFFEKKWFITSQGTINFVASAPLAGNINLYGVSGTALFRLYANATSNVSSTVRTALSPMKDPIRTKQALKFGIEATLTSPASFQVTVDSESGSSPTYTLNNAVIWFNNVGTTLTWVNNSSQTIGWLTGSGYALYKSDAQQYGKYLGLTMTSNSAGFVLNTIEFEHELRVRF